MDSPLSPVPPQQGQPHFLGTTRFILLASDHRNRRFLLPYLDKEDGHSRDEPQGSQAHLELWNLQDPRMLTNVQYNIPVSSASLPAIKSLGLRGITCISLTNLDDSPASHEVLECVAYPVGPHLQSLCLSGGSPSEAAFVALILGCPALRILDLSGCNSLFTSGMLLAQPETAQRVQQVLSGLCELNLAGLWDLTDLSFNRLSSCAPSLERLSLAYCHLTFELGPVWGSLGPQDSSPSQLSFHNLLWFVKERAGRLHALDLSGTGLLPEALQALGQVAGLQLQELSLHGCQDLSTEAVAALCRLQSGLISLDLGGCSGLADGALVAISRGLGHLQRLNLRKLQRLTDAGCMALGGLQELQSLDLAECCLVSGWGLAQALGSGHRAPAPRASLSLAYCASLKDHLRAKLRRNLRSRSLFPQLHQELEHQASGPKEPPQPQGPSLLMLRALQELDLTACSKLTDASLAKVLRFPQLRQLSLSLLPALTDKGLVAVAKGCPSLEHLVLSHCSLLSDEGWAQAASSWPRLRHLNLSSCSQLTEQTLDTIGQACKQLRMLDVSMCPGISMAAIRHFQAQLPQVACIQSRFVGGADLTLTL
ncbi:F-box/LRR-repeat protein 2-like isoform X4 [Prionailurus viverrinus]|uniref:F-box/LRR-repeat protein 2-like isoform X4 n=1 Tax=Prionailurus viverrinus TaxID=61388 RepID=UPI001FF60FC2|nr:F-box/LRR-repeat protein 2-like isoform X4 [Prionailurus viverrinus]